jgi:hypothetical protein
MNFFLKKQQIILFNLFLMKIIVFKIKKTFVFSNHQFINYDTHIVYGSFFKSFINEFERERERERGYIYVY